MGWIVPTASAEAGVTGLFLIVSPSLFSWLILDAELSEPGRALGRLGGIALVGFALTAWPAPATAVHATSAMRALLIYNLLATIYLAYLGFAGQIVGILLWPAVAVHVLLLILLGRVWVAAGGK